MNKKINCKVSIIMLQSILFSYFNAFCQHDAKDTLRYEYRDGIYFEICTDTTNLARYNEDNEIYQAENRYYYTYLYKTKSGNEFYYSHLWDHTWEFVPKENLHDSTIVGFYMKVMPDLGSFKKLPDYNQSVIEYTYLMNNGEINSSFSEATGLVENVKNIWLHPPREDLFQVLEINPFPFIQKPYLKGNKWKWSLSIGDFWCDPRWKTWEGLIQNTYKYEITDTNSFVSTPLGNLKCYKINACAKSKIGKTYLVAYFNEVYGFVRLEYTNIDNSQIIISLDEVHK